MNPLDGEGATCSLPPLHSRASCQLLRKENGTMKCSRCGGYMAIEPSNDFYDAEGRWRCVNCGAHKARHARDPLKSIIKAPHTISDP